MQTVYKFTAVALAAVLLFIAVFSAYAFFNSGTLISDSENRTLMPLPPLTAGQWFGGTYGTRLDGYLSDHVLLREHLISFTRALERLMRLQSKIRIIDITKSN